MNTRSEMQGRSIPMTAFSPIPRYWSRWLKLYWRLLKPLENWRSPFGRWIIAHAPGLKDVDSLTRLSMISFARWSLLEKASPDGANKENFLLFESNFNGDHDSYLEAFSLVVPTSMRLTWRLGPFGGPGIPDVGNVSEFLRYVNERQIRPISGYYRAYPNVSTKMVRAALELRPRVERFDSQFRDDEPAAFIEAYQEFLADVQNIRNPRLESTHKTATGVLSVLAPVVEDEEGLKSKLDSLSLDPGRVIPTDRTHFARWVFVERLDHTKKGTDEGTPHLLFSAWFDRRSEDSEEQGQEQYVRALHRSLGGMEAIWQHCGFENTGDPNQFWKDIRDHRVPLGIPFYGYQNVTVKEVEDALEWSEAFWAFAADCQGKGAGDLHRKWREAFPLRRIPFSERRKIPTRVEDVVAA
jgi:hypothetical protein